MTETAATTLALLAARDPAALLLARFASLAARIEPELLRALRLALVPTATAGTEAELWFSEAVYARGASTITLDPDIVVDLRADVLNEPRDRVARAFRIVRRIHRYAPALLLIEERLVLWSLLGRNARIDAELGQVVSAMLTEPSRAEDLAAWALRALPRLPSAARDTDAYWSLLFAANARLPSSSFEPPPSVAAVTAAVPAIFASVKDAHVAVERRGDTVRLRLVDDASNTVPAPAVRPVVVVVISENHAAHASIARRDCWSDDIPVTGPTIRLRVADGREHTATITAHAAVSAPVVDLDRADRAIFLRALVERAMELTVADENGHWILVDGTDRSTVPADDEVVARMLGRTLARTGFSLITLGSQGVAQVVAASFWGQLEQLGYTSGIYRMMHFVPRGQTAAYEEKGRTLEVSDSHPIPVAAVARASAVLTIGLSQASSALADAAIVAGIPAWWLTKNLRGFKEVPDGKPKSWAPDSLRDFSTRLGSRLLTELDVRPTTLAHNDRRAFEAAARALDLPSRSQYDTRLELLRSNVSPNFAVCIRDPQRPAYRLVGYLSAERITPDEIVGALRAELRSVRATWGARTLLLALEALRARVPSERSTQDDRNIAAICHVIEREIVHEPRIDLAGDCKKLLRQINSGGHANNRATELVSRAEEYERIRGQRIPGQERTAQLDAFVDQVAAWSVPGCAMEAEIWFTAGDAGLRIVALALLFRARPQNHLPDIIDQSLLGSVSAFEQFTALRAAQVCLAGLAEQLPDRARLDRFAAILRGLSIPPRSARSSLVEQMLWLISVRFDPDVVTGRVCRVELLGQDRRWCTGFLVASDLVVTTGDAVEYLGSGRQPNLQFQFPSGTASVDLNNHLVRPISDLVLIRITPAIGENVGWFELVREWTDPVTLVCHTDVTSNSVLLRAQLVGRRGSAFEYWVEQELVHGSSGGPLVDAAGRVIAVQTSALRTAGQDSISFLASTASELIEIVEGRDVDLTRLPTDQTTTGDEAFNPSLGGLGPAASRSRAGDVLDDAEIPTIDVLIVVALEDELDAVFAEGGGADGWRQVRDHVYIRTLQNDAGQELGVAAVWTGAMGAMASATRAAPLVKELQPSCLAMCGICAGKRGDVALGDVIVADRVYSFDHGKLVAAEDDKGPPSFFHDITTYNLERSWRMDAAAFRRDLGWAKELLPSRPPTKEAQRRWLVRVLRAHEQESGPAPLAHPERSAMFRTATPGATDWARLILELRKQGLLEPGPGVLKLTEAGRLAAEEDHLLYPDGAPLDPPFQVHVGPIATGNAVLEDPHIFDRLKLVGRKTLGVEMEAVAIGYLGDTLPQLAIVAKAVSDHPDHNRDNRFREFACRASAAWLLAFLKKHLAPKPLKEVDPRRSGRPAARRRPGSGG